MTPTTQRRTRQLLPPRPCTATTTATYRAKCAGGKSASSSRSCPANCLQRPCWERAAEMVSARPKNQRAPPCFCWAIRKEPTPLPSDPVPPWTPAPATPQATLHHNPGLEVVGVELAGRLGRLERPAQWRWGRHSPQRPPICQQQQRPTRKVWHPTSPFGRAWGCPSPSRASPSSWTLAA